ncbi:phage head closure protein [Brochothrix campestris]|uniref:Phage head-tail adaptor n=1 Tax=Brochothrix campestris FSL F6-1037 TaxID=1265861 RepID=W7CAD3_9LIST|nr:phage head closure protein [Brochothrix campestris]EUJ34270.1 phage head-tail adaptor [Brochothrix campestris FSL F6-1037]
MKKKNDKDELGGNIVIDTVVFSCWSSVQSQFLNEIKSTIGTVLEDTLTFIIRYQQIAEVKNNMKIVFDGETYEIVKITKGVSRKDFTTIIAKAVN